MKGWEFFFAVARESASDQAMTASVEGLSKMPLGDGGVDWRTYKFNLDNTMSLLRICGKSAEERAVAAAMQKIIVVL